jgi:hypothetical protein
MRACEPAHAGIAPNAQARAATPAKLNLYGETADLNITTPKELYAPIRARFSRRNCKKTGSSAFGEAFTLRLMAYSRVVSHFQ